MKPRLSNRRGRYCIITNAIVGLSTAMFGTDAVSAEDSIENLFTEGTVDLSFRYRFETVDQDGLSDEARASTLRSRLSLQSGPYRKFNFFVEVDDVHEIGADDFNAGAGNTPDRMQYPVVADPEGTEVNQAYVEYGGMQNWSWRLGRQRLNLDNQRFVGGVAWRQNEQTFDALKAVYQHGSVAAQYVYVNKVRRIFGNDVPAGTHDQDGTHLLNVAGGAGGLGEISGYYYRIDNEDAPTDSTDTYGLRLSGVKDAYDFKVRYTAEYATQRDVANNPVDFRASYWNLDAGVIFGDFDLGLGWEVLTGNAGNPGEAFRTPLATLHAFNGWADVFLTTPDAGIDDRYLKFRGIVGKAIAQIRYHAFEAEDGGADFGHEWDFQIGYKLTDRLRGDLFLASYDGSSGIADTDKLWLVLSMKL